MRRLLLVCACIGCGADGSRGDETTSPSTSVGTTQGESSGAASSSGGTSSGSSSGVLDTSEASDDGPDGPPTLARIADTFVIPTLAAAMPKRFADAAQGGDVYLVVNGNAATSGVFLDADGVALGEPFAIADTDAWTQGQRVAFGGGSFLVAWHDNRDDPNGARLRARSVAWDGAAPVLGADVEIGTGASYSEMPPAIAWSGTSQVFLIAWHTLPGDDIHAQRVASDGARVGDPIVLTADPDWQSDAGLAWHPARDEWLAVYTHAGATTEVRARIVAADGTLPGAESSLVTAAGTWLAQAAYVPASDDYLAAWFDGAMTVRRVAIDGTPAGDPIVLAPGYGSYDGFAIAYSAVNDRFAAVFHGTSDEDFAIAFDADGTQSAVLEATMSRGADGHFNPHVVAHGTRPEWLLVTSRGFAEIVGQRLGP